MTRTERSEFVQTRAAISRSSRQNSRQFQDLEISKIPKRVRNDVLVKQWSKEIFTPAFTLAEGTTYIAMLPTKTKFGFTLAEVLITLGIIGVVAAMTIPGLISNYQRTQAETRLKQAYSILTNTIRKSEMENEGSLSAFYPNLEVGYGDEFRKSYIDKYLTGLTYYKSTRVYTPSGKDSTHVKGFNTLYPCMQNGICYWMYNHGSNYSYIYVDINGVSGPNRQGHDIFNFAVHYKDMGTVLDGLVYGVNLSTTTDKLYESCSKTSDSAWNGETCMELIIRNGWKIPKDNRYPW